MRKDIFISDENYDLECEKICDENGWSYGKENDFVKTLSSDFQKQIDDFGEKWVSVNFYPDQVIDCIAPIEIYGIAYEFANGFMIFQCSSSFMF